MPIDRQAPPDKSASNGLTSLGNGFGHGRVVDLQRARILAAMTAVCVELGVAKVTVTDVVERAKVSRRTFYEIFDDLEECLLATLDHALTRARTYVLAAYDRDVAWAARVRSALIALLEFFEIERDGSWLLIVGSLGVGAEALELRRSVLAQLAAVIDEGRKQSRAARNPPPLTAEGVVGGIYAVLHARLVDPRDESLLELTGPLMGMIVLPYQGMAAVGRELKRSTPARLDRPEPALVDPLRDVGMRLTYRTVRVLLSIAAHPGSSNREIGQASGIDDQGQMSKLLTRLHKLGLIENGSARQANSIRNAWMLTARGREIEQALAEPALR